VRECSESSPREKAASDNALILYWHILADVETALLFSIRVLEKNKIPRLDRIFASYSRKES